MDILYEGHTLEHWKNNAEEDYAKVPISVLKYISVLEDVIEFSFSKEKVVYLITKAISETNASNNRNVSMLPSKFIEQNL
jgi:hypothetical protein